MTATLEQTERRPSGKEVKIRLLHQLVEQDIKVFDVFDASHIFYSGKLSYKNSGGFPGFYLGKVQITPNGVFNVNVDERTMKVYGFMFYQGWR